MILCMVRDFGHKRSSSRRSVLAAVGLFVSLGLSCRPPALLAHAPRDGRTSFSISPQPSPSVKLSQAQFEAAMARLATEARVIAQPAPSLRFVSTSVNARVDGMFDLAHDYENWCEHRKARRGDCLSLGSAFGAREKRSLALSLALESGSVWNGASDAVGAMLDPLLLQATVATFMTGYMALLLLPEPSPRLSWSR